MSNPLHRFRLPPGLVTILQEAHAEYEVIHKKNHFQLRVDGRVILTMPHHAVDTGFRRANAEAALRRHLRNAK